jgi:hypothetical protein
VGALPFTAGIGVDAGTVGLLAVPDVGLPLPMAIDAEVPVAMAATFGPFGEPTITGAEPDAPIPISTR